MEGLSNRSILEIWERARGTHPLERALTILTAACPSLTRRELARLSVGRRDALLLEVQSRTFGNRLDACVACPSCRELLEFETRVPDPGRPAGQPRGDDRTFHLETSDISLRYRLPDSFDLAAAIRERRTAPARQTLAGACVLEMERGGQPAAAASLTDAELELLGEAILQSDPLSEITFEVTCPACGYESSSLFEVGTYLWREIEVRAEQLLREIDALARAYAWSESEILALSDTRRQSYLQLVETP